MQLYDNPALVDGKRYRHEKLGSVHTTGWSYDTGDTSMKGFSAGATEAFAEVAFEIRDMIDGESFLRLGDFVEAVNNLVGELDPTLMPHIYLRGEVEGAGRWVNMPTTSSTGLSVKAAASGLTT